MLVRIVKLTFKEESISDFLEIFEKHREGIKSFEGFSSIELLQAKSNERMFFTYSHWKDEAALENYRKSKYFKDIWSSVKLLFSDKPEAWSSEKI